MVTFDEIHQDEKVLVTDEVGLVHNDGGFTNGKLMLTQKRLVFIIGGGFFGPKQKTDHAIDLNLIDSVSLEPRQTVGVNLRVDFTTFDGPATVRYHCRLIQAQKMVDFINMRVDRGVLR